MRSRRRAPTSWRPVIIGLAGLLLAAGLNAETLDATARSQAFGWRRDIATAVSGPLVTLSRAVGLTEPRGWLEDVLDRPSTRPPAERPTPTTTTSTIPTTTSSTAPDTGRPSTTTTTTFGRRRGSAEDPLRVWIAGDSMTEVLGGVLVDDLAATGVASGEHDFRYSSGLTRPDFFDWPAEAARVLAADDPDVAIVSFGANDAQGIATPSGPEPFGTEAWVAEYRSRVAAMMDLLGRDGRVVYWVGLPIMRPSGYADRMALLDEVYREEAARRPATVRFVDTWSLLADEDGRYTDYLPGEDGSPVLVRRSDGIHLTTAGAERVSAFVLSALRADDVLPA